MRFAQAEASPSTTSAVSVALGTLCRSVGQCLQALTLSGEPCVLDAQANNVQGCCVGITSRLVLKCDKSALRPLLRALCQGHSDGAMLGQGSLRWRPESDIHEPNYDPSECAASHMAEALIRARHVFDVALRFASLLVKQAGAPSL